MKRNNASFVPVGVLLAFLLSGILVKNVLDPWRGIPQPAVPLFAHHVGTGYSSTGESRMTFIDAVFALALDHDTLTLTHQSGVTQTFQRVTSE